MATFPPVQLLRVERGRAATCVLRSYVREHCIHSCSDAPTRVGVQTHDKLPSRSKSWLRRFDIVLKPPLRAVTAVSNEFTVRMTHVGCRLHPGSFRNGNGPGGDGAKRQSARSIPLVTCDLLSHVLYGWACQWGVLQHSRLACCPRPLFVHLLLLLCSSFRMPLTALANGPQ